MKFFVPLLFGVFACSSALAQNTLYVGSYYADQILRYDQSGNITQPEPWLGPYGNAVNTNAIQGEGIAVGANFPTSGSANTFGNISNPIYIVNALTNSIEVANGNAASTANPIVNANFITGLNGGANIALSNYGQTLYVAQEGAGSVTEYNALTGAVITSVSGITDAHDVVVGANGNVYVTAYGAGVTQTTGVMEFSQNLTNEQTFIAENTSAGTGNGGAALTLNHMTGMCFDASGNFWVANVYSSGGTVVGVPINNEDFVSEFSSTGTLIHTIEATGNNLYTVFGLSLGPDGNIYAASFNGNEVTKINTTTYALSTFAVLPYMGDEPKYAVWSSDAVNYSTVPEPKSYGFIYLGGVALLLALRRFQRQRVLSPAAV